MFIFVFYFIYNFRNCTPPSKVTHTLCRYMNGSVAHIVVVAKDSGIPARQTSVPVIVHFPSGSVSAQPRSLEQNVFMVTLVLGLISGLLLIVIFSMLVYICKSKKGSRLHPPSSTPWGSLQIPSSPLESKNAAKRISRSEIAIYVHPQLDPGWVCMMASCTSDLIDLPSISCLISPRMSSNDNPFVFRTGGIQACYQDWRHKIRYNGPDHLLSQLLPDAFSLFSRVLEQCMRGTPSTNNQLLSAKGTDIARSGTTGGEILPCSPCKFSPKIAAPCCKIRVQKEVTPKWRIKMADPYRIKTGKTGFRNRVVGSKVKGAPELGWWGRAACWLSAPRRRPSPVVWLVERTLSILPSNLSECPWLENINRIDLILLNVSENMYLNYIFRLDSGNLFN